MISILIASIAVALLSVSLYNLHQINQFKEQMLINEIIDDIQCQELVGVSVIIGMVCGLVAGYMVYSEITGFIGILTGMITLTFITFLTSIFGTVLVLQRLG